MIIDMSFRWCLFKNCCIYLVINTNSIIIIYQRTTPIAWFQTKEFPVMCTPNQRNTHMEKPDLNQKSSFPKLILLGLETSSLTEYKYANAWLLINNCTVSFCRHLSIIGGLGVSLGSTPIFSPITSMFQKYMANGVNFFAGRQGKNG